MPPGLSLRNLLPACESQEWWVNPLKKRRKIRFEILFPEEFSTLRICSITGEQNALSRGFRGSQTETAVNRLNLSGPDRERRDTMGILGIAKSPSSECHGRA
jgi:hypothetical protein